MPRFATVFALLFVGLFSAFVARAFPPAAHAGGGDDNTVVQDFAELWNTGVLQADTNILTEGVTQSTKPFSNLSVLRVTVALVTTDSVFKVVETDGTHTVTNALNGGVALTHGCLYTFSFGVRKLASSDGTASTLPLKVNFQLGTTSSVSVLRTEQTNSPNF